MDTSLETINSLVIVKIGNDIPIMNKNSVSNNTNCIIFDSLGNCAAMVVM